MARGGRRPGAGRKKVVKDQAVVVNTTPPPQRQIYSEGAMALMIEFMKESGRKKHLQRTPQTNPYRIRPELFGPVSAHIKGNVSRARRLAMDDNSALVSANAFAVDSWQNGGMISDNASEGLLFLGYPYLSELAQRPEYRLFGEIRAEEMTRNWIEFRGTDDESDQEKDKPKDRNKEDDEADKRRDETGESPRKDTRNKEIQDKIKELNDFAEHLKLKQWFKDVAVWDSHMGIGHLYLDLKNANVEDMRDPENRMSIGNGRDETSKAKLGKGCLLGLRTIEPIWCYPTTYNASNPLVKSWYDPQVWYVMGAEIHKTRLLPFISRPVPDILKPAYAFGGLSMSQMAKPYVDIWLRTRESVGELIHAFSVMILMTNMGTQTQPGGAGGGNGDVVMRMMQANALRDNQGMMVIDKGTEDFKNISAPISGLDQLQAQAQEHLFSVGRIPAVKFTGIDPHGLNASSEGSLRAFGESIHGAQEQLFRSHLTTIIDIMMISLWGARDPDITFDFLPLQELTMKEKAEIRKIEAETDQIRIDSGVIGNDEVRKKVVADPESGYDGLDPDDVPDLLQEEEGGLIPEGAGKGLEAELANAGGKGGDDDERPQPRRKPEGRDSAVLPFDGASDSTSGATDDWNEKDHPRGQPGNAGQFGSGGKGSSGKSARNKMPDIPAFLKAFKGGSGNEGEHHGQKLKMPQFGLTATPWESHQFVKGFSLPARKPMPKSDKNPEAAESTVAFVPGEGHDIKELNGVAFKSWDAPEDLEGWADVEGQEDIDEPLLPDLPEGMSMSSGCVIQEPDGRVWLMRPKNGFGGYDQTWPKGGVEEGLSPQANAIKEVFEETGLQVRITGFVGDYEGDVTVSRFYTAERVGGDPDDAGWEAEGVILVPSYKVQDLLNRKRDRNIARTLVNDQAMDEFVESEHPRGPGGKFATVAGGGGSSEEPKTFKTKKEHVAHLLTKGATAAEILKGAGYAPGTQVSIPGLAKKMGLTLEKTKINGITKYTGKPIGASAPPPPVGAASEAEWNAFEKQAFPQNKPKLNPNKLDKIGEQKGSNEGGVFKDYETGEKFYIKRLKTKDHVKSELTAAALYQLAGVNTLTYREVQGGNHVATEMVDLEKKNIAELTPAERKEAQKDFAIHAWLANWDAAGTGGDNQGVVDGKVTTLDVGGSLRYRAQGEPKGKAFGDKVDEVVTMIDPKKSPEGHYLFGDMTYEDRKASAQIVCDIPNEQIRKACGDDKELADTLIMRKNDLAQTFGNPTFEQKHPRDAEGHFIKGAGGEENNPQKGLSGEVEEPTSAPKTKIDENAPHFPTYGIFADVFFKMKKQNNVASMLGLLKSNPQHMKPLAEKYPKMIASLNDKYPDVMKDVGEGAKTKFTPATELAESKPAASAEPEFQPPKTYEEFKQQLKDAVANKDTETFNGLMKWNPEWKEQLVAEKSAEAKPPAPEPTKPKIPEFPPPTEAEMQKAKKSVALQMQYVPGGKPELHGGEPMKAAQQIIDKFNEKYAGKELANDPAALAQKVQDFKALTFGINELAKQENAKKAEIEAAAKAHAVEVAKKAKEQAEAEKAAEKKKFQEQHAEVTAALGITEPHQLEAFDAFIDHFGGTKAALDKFKSWQKQAENAAKSSPGHGFEKLSGFEMGCIKAYTGPQSGWINQAILSDFATPAQHMFEQVLNSALDKLPKKTGLVRRGLTLNAKVLAGFKPGVVWTHRNFASSNSKGWGGNTKLHIEATGKSGSYVDPISSHQGEGETLFKSNLKLMISKVEKGSDGITNVYCKEM